MEYYEWRLLDKVRNNIWHPVVGQQRPAMFRRCPRGIHDALMLSLCIRGPPGHFLRSYLGSVLMREKAHEGGRGPSMASARSNVDLR